MSCEEEDRPPKCKDFKCEQVCKEHAEQICKSKSSPKPGGGIRGLLQGLPMPWGGRGITSSEKELIKALLPSLAIYGAAALAAVIYFCDWRTVVWYMPYYRGKFSDEFNNKEEKKKKKKKKKKEDPPPSEEAEPEKKPPEEKK